MLQDVRGYTQEGRGKGGQTGRGAVEDGVAGVSFPKDGVWGRQVASCEVIDEEVDGSGSHCAWEGPADAEKQVLPNE